MLCERCKKNNAKFHFTQILNGNKTQIYLCELCARQNSGIDIDIAHDFKLFFPDGLIITGAMGNNYGINNKIEKCDRCGLTYDSFRETGKFGCAECYTTFENKIKPLLKRIHGNIVHNGKTTARVNSVINKKREHEELKKQLESSIVNEEYEKAAVFRDKIKELEG